MSPNGKIVGLQFDQESDEAPRISLRSSDAATIKEILTLAKKHRIPVLPKAQETSLLFSTPLDQTIPERLYKIVATILKSLQLDAISKTSL